MSQELMNETNENAMPINYLDAVGTTTLRQKQTYSGLLAFGNLILLEHPAANIAVTGFLEEIRNPYLILSHFNPTQQDPEGFRVNFFKGKKRYTLEGVTQVTVIDSTKLVTKPLRSGRLCTPSLDAILYLSARGNEGEVAGYMKSMRGGQVTLSYENPLLPNSGAIRRSELLGDKSADLSSFATYAFILPRRQNPDTDNNPDVANESQMLSFGGKK